MYVKWLSVNKGLRDSVLNVHPFILKANDLKRNKNSEMHLNMTLSEPQPLCCFCMPSDILQLHTRTRRRIYAELVFVCNLCESKTSLEFKLINESYVQVQLKVRLMYSALGFNYARLNAMVITGARRFNLIFLRIKEKLVSKTSHKRKAISCAFYFCLYHFI